MTDSRKPADPSDRPSGSIPVVREALDLDKERVATGKVAVSVAPRERVERVDLESRSEFVELERVSVGREVPTAREPWYDGDTLVVPVYEEEVTVQRRLILKEEIRLKRQAQVRRWQEDVPLRQDEVRVERRRAEDGREP